MRCEYGCLTFRSCEINAGNCGWSTIPGQEIEHQTCMDSCYPPPRITPAPVTPSSVTLAPIASTATFPAPTLASEVAGCDWITNTGEERNFEKFMASCNANPLLL